MAWCRACPVHLPLRGQRRLGWPCRPSPLLPVELQRVNHTASTNLRILRSKFRVPPKMASAMSQSAQIDQIAERVDRLLVRYEELQRTNDLLTARLEVTRQERDSLQSRLNAARSRVEALLERLPEDAPPKDAA